MEKKLSEISRTEWIKYQWIDVTQMGDEERIMLQGFLRTPDESYQAIEEWDVVEQETSEQETSPTDNGTFNERNVDA
jgi:hypothetical protein